MDSLLRWLASSGFIATYPTQQPSADRPLLTRSSYSGVEVDRPFCVRRPSVGVTVGWLLPLPSPTLDGKRVGSKPPGTGSLRCYRGAGGHEIDRPQQRSVARSP